MSERIALPILLLLVAAVGTVLGYAGRGVLEPTTPCPATTPASETDGASHG